MTDSSPKRRPRIAFRVDGGTRLGSGHVMRCLTLANELRRRGASARFICREAPGHFVDRIEEEGYRVDRLSSGLASMEDSAGAEAAMQEDAIQTLDALSSVQTDWMVVDHYSLDGRWQRAVRSRVGRILVIEDRFDRSHECDILLNQNWRGKDLESDSFGEPPKSRLCFRLVGPRYALLRPEYVQLRGVMPPRIGVVRRVLVSFGGSDPTDETGKALDALSCPELAHLAVDVVIGRNYLRGEAISEKVKSRPSTELHFNPTSLAGLMMRADLAIGAGGSTTWERLCLGVPSIVTILAENQELVAKPLANEALIVLLGCSATTTIEDYRNAVRTNLQIFTDVQPLVDGYGVWRVAEFIVPTDSERLSLRGATAQDAVLFFDWRNDPLVRAMSFTQRRISWAEHTAWFRRQLENGDVRLYVAEADGLPIGQLRVEFQRDETVLSYSIDRLVRGRGWSAWLIQEGLARTERAATTRIRADVKPENVASRKVFTRLGWTETLSAAGHIVFHLPRRRSGNRR